MAIFHTILRIFNEHISKTKNRKIDWTKKKDSVTFEGEGGVYISLTKYNPIIELTMRK